MPLHQEARIVREAVGVFTRSEDLQSAIDELLSSGFHRADLSLLASEHAVEQKLGHRYEKITALADDPTIPRTVYVSPAAIGDAEGAGRESLPSPRSEWLTLTAGLRSRSVTEWKAGRLTCRPAFSVHECPALLEKATQAAATRLQACAL